MTTEKLVAGPLRGVAEDWKAQIVLRKSDQSNVFSLGMARAYEICVSDLEALASLPSSPPQSDSEKWHGVRAIVEQMKRRVASPMYSWETGQVAAISDVEGWIEDLAALASPVQGVQAQCSYCGDECVPNVTACGEGEGEP